MVTQPGPERVDQVLAIVDGTRELEQKQRYLLGRRPVNQPMEADGQDSSFINRIERVDRARGNAAVHVARRPVGPRPFCHGDTFLKYSTRGGSHQLSDGNEKCIDLDDVHVNVVAVGEQPGVFDDIGRSVVEETVLEASPGAIVEMTVWRSHIQTTFTQKAHEKAGTCTPRPSDRDMMPASIMVNRWIGIGDHWVRIYPNRSHGCCLSQRPASRGRCPQMEGGSSR